MYAQNMSTLASVNALISAEVRCGFNVSIEPRLSGFMRLTAVACISNTKGMKVAVSIPDDIFAEAEALAKRLKSYRSEIYSRALGEFIGTHAPDCVTERMNDVVRDVGPEPDAFSAAAGRQVLKKTEW